MTPVFHITVLSNFTRGGDMFRRVYSKAGVRGSTFPSRSFLLLKRELAIAASKAPAHLEKLTIQDNQFILAGFRDCAERPLRSTSPRQIIIRSAAPQAAAEKLVAEELQTSRQEAAEP